MMLADVGITVMMKLVMNDASFFGPAKAVYVACSQWRVCHSGTEELICLLFRSWGADRQGLVKWHDIIGHYYRV